MVPKGAKSAPRRVQEPLRRPPEPPTFALRVAWTATWGKPVTQVPPAGLEDAILAPSGLHFGPCGNRLRRAFQARPGACRKLWRIQAGTMLNLYFSPPPWGVREGGWGPPPTGPPSGVPEISDGALGGGGAQGPPKSATRLSRQAC